MSNRADWPRRSFLGRLGGGDREALLRLGASSTFVAGQRLVRQGERSRHVVLITSGFVKVTTVTPDGHETLLAVRGPGDVIGELAALSGATRSATVTACGRRVIGRVVAHGALERFLTAHPDASRVLTGVVGDRLLWANRRRADFVSLPARARLASVLVDLAEIFAEGVAGSAPVRVGVAQIELASIAGLREVTVQKELRGLRDLGAVATAYRQVTVTDRLLLRALAEPPSGDRAPS